MASSDDQVISGFAFRAMRSWLVWSISVGTVNTQILNILMGITGERMLRTAALMPLVFLVVGITIPYASIRFLAGRALRHLPGDEPGERLARILEMPWRIAAFTTFLAYTVGGVINSTTLVFWNGLDRSLLGVGVLVSSCFGVVMIAPVGLGMEKLALAHALEERKKYPTRPLDGSGFFWPRQSWFLPSTYIASILALLVVSGCVVATKMAGLQGILAQELGIAEAKALAGKMEAVLVSELGQALLWVCALILILPAVTYWLLARRQERGASAVGAAIGGLASGKVSAPEWISTDEIGDLASGLNTVLEKLRLLPQALHTSATRLLDAGNNLSVANQDQQQTLSLQAAALQEAQVTSQEIKQTSMTAADRAEAVLRVAQRAEDLGRNSETTIEQTLANLASMLEVVNAIQSKLVRLEESATQIGTITQAVKGLADRSNMLALNAAIEAVRSGEHGKGFGVVAKEIRSLSNQSIGATVRIQGVLDEVADAIRDAARMGEKGVQQIAGGLDKLKTSGDSLKELSKITQENSAAVRQIAAAVTQQNTGITQIFGAIHDLSLGMDATLKRLESTQQAATMLQTVSNEVTEMARQFNMSGG